MEPAFVADASPHNNEWGFSGRHPGPKWNHLHYRTLDRSLNLGAVPDERIARKPRYFHRHAGKAISSPLLSGRPMKIVHCNNRITLMHKSMPATRVIRAFTLIELLVVIA